MRNSLDMDAVGGGEVGVAAVGSSLVRGVLGEGEAGAAVVGGGEATVVQTGACIGMMSPSTNTAPCTAPHCQLNTRLMLLAKLCTGQQRTL
jgi:hypothetical protein